MNAIKQVSAILSAYNPEFARKDFTPVLRWLAEGCDLEQDILPTIREWTARKTDIHSLGFFWPYVDMRRADRIRTEVADPDVIHRKARSIAFLIRRLDRCMPAEARWLAEYEQLHGPVAELHPCHAR